MTDTALTTDAQSRQEPMVLLHGWGMHSGIWQACPDALWQGADLHALDLPGHGTRQTVPSRDDLWGWSEACLERAPERAVWVGWSLGGLVALAAARRAPTRVSKLILLTATPRFTQAVDWTPAMPEARLAQFHRELATDPSGTLNRFLALQVRGSDAARETLRVIRQALAAAPEPEPTALSRGLDLLAEEDLRGQLPDLQCPALWVYGSHDALVPAAAAERIALLMPGASTKVVAGAAHAPHLSHPRETADAIRDFLTTCAEAA